ncbi:MAG: ABC transporter ATP-binding protein [Alistipes sp.]|nr:ABC transporter ATP-binding protein [Alistipes sp.]
MVKRIYSLLSEHQRKYSMGVIFTVLLRSLLDYAGVAALIPIILLLTDRFGNDKRTTLLLCAGVIVFVTAKNAVILLLARLQIRFQLRVFKNFSRRMFINYYRRGLLFLKQKSSVQLAYEVNGVAQIFSQNVLSSLFRIAGEGVLILLMLGSLLIWKPFMGLLICALFVPLAFLYTGIVRKRLRQLGTENIQAQREQSRTVVEAFRGYSELEIAQAYDASLVAFDRNMESIMRNRLGIELYQLCPLFLSDLAVVAGLTLLVCFGDGDLSVIGGVFAIATFRIIPAVKGILNSWATLQNASFAIDVVEKGLRAEEEIAVIDSQAAFTFARGMEVRNLAFAFPDGHTLFSELSFGIRRGERIGIRGRSGSGKSTLFNLLLGFFEPSAGEIRIDGVPLSPRNRHAWYKIVGYVPQEIFIINGSLAENIALGQAETDNGRIARVLEQVQLKAWADELPQGLDTPLGEFGSRLSGGQKQRIGIARALYKGAEVLFFDEATSSLDSRTEQEINLALKELSATCHELTLIIIAHRESSIAFCDRILDMDALTVYDNTQRP